MSAVYKGWIWEKDTTLLSYITGAYRKKYMVLQSDAVLKYYKDSDCKEVEGQIDLNKISNIEETGNKHKLWKFAFQIDTLSAEFFFSCQSFQSRAEWMANIHSLLPETNNHITPKHTQDNDLKYNDNDNDLKYNDNDEKIEQISMQENNLNEKIVWYIINKKRGENIEIIAKYSTSSSPTQFTNQVKMNRIRQLSSEKPETFSIYQAVINLKQNINDQVFLKLFKRDINNDNIEKQIYHQTTFGTSKSNHAITKDKEHYVWNITNDDNVYLLDSRGNEKNTATIYRAAQHIRYYSVVLEQLVNYLYKNINKHYSPYVVMETLKAIYKLLTDKKQLNWSPETAEPVQLFIFSLESRFTFNDIDDIKQRVTTWNDMVKVLISLFVILSIGIKTACAINKPLQLIYQHLTDSDNFVGICIEKRIALFRILFGGNYKLVQQTKNMFYQKTECITVDVEQYFYDALWYNIICCVFGNDNNTPAKPTSPKSAKSASNNAIKFLKRNDLIRFVKLDQRLSMFGCRPFLFDVLLINEIFKTFEHLKLNEKQHEVFNVLDALNGLRCLYNALIKYENYIFGEIVIANDCNIWLKFVDYILQRIKKDIDKNKPKKFDTHLALKTFVFEKFCKTTIITIDSKQNGNKLLELHKKWFGYMNCEMICDHILQNEFLIQKREFISICSKRLKEKKNSELEKYIEIWLTAAGITISEIVDIFYEFEFDWKVLAYYLLQKHDYNANLVALKKEIEKINNNEDKVSLNELVQRLSNNHQNQNNLMQLYQKELNKNQQLRLQNESFKVQITKQQKSIEANQQLIQEQKKEIVFLNSHFDEKENKNDDHSDDDDESDEYKNLFEVWLRKTVKLGKYLANFVKAEENDIRMVEFLNENELKRIGITTDVHRKLIMKEVSKLMNGQEGNNTGYH